MTTTPQKLLEIKRFFTTFEYDNDIMHQDWRDFRGYYSQAYIWGWKDPSFKQTLREIARVVPGHPSDLVQKLETKKHISDNHYDKIIDIIHDAINTGHMFRNWRNLNSTTN